MKRDPRGDRASGPGAGARKGSASFRELDGVIV